MVGEMKGGVEVVGVGREGGKGVGDGGVGWEVVEVGVD